jgi:hypothetical protein
LSMGEEGGVRRNEWKKERKKERKKSVARA